MMHSRLFLAVVLVMIGCGGTRHYTVTRDDSGLKEFEETIGRSDVTIRSMGGVYRGVEITSVSPESVTFLGEDGHGSVRTTTIFMIVNERSGWGIVWGALGGAIGGGMIGGMAGANSYQSHATGWAPDMGGVGAAAGGVLVGGGIGLMIGAAIGNTLDQDDVYTFEEPRK